MIRIGVIFFSSYIALFRVFYFQVGWYSEDGFLCVGYLRGMRAFYNIWGCIVNWDGNRDLVFFLVYFSDSDKRLVFWKFFWEVKEIRGEKRVFMSQLLFELWMLKKDGMKYTYIELIGGVFRESLNVILIQFGVFCRFFL